MDNPPPAAPAATTAGPLAFGDTTYVDRVLADAGWNSRIFAPFDASARLGGDNGVAGAVSHALDTTAAKTLLALGDATLRDRAAAVLSDQFSAMAVDGVVRFPAAAWIVSARR